MSGSALATYDLAIVGSGPVGLAVAHRLRGAGMRIVVLEAGHGAHDTAVQEDAFGASAHSPNTHAAAHLYRRRMLGGTSTVWGGRCLPYEPEDFAAHPHRPAWPIPFEAVAAYWESALGFLEAGEARFDETAFAKPIVTSQAKAALAFDDIERFSCPTNVWARYREDLHTAGVEVLSGHLVRRLLCAPDGGRIAGLEVLARPDADVSILTARQVVLACGGIETPRLLLASGGIGNHADKVGRHYMTHVIADLGSMIYSSAVPIEKLNYRMTRDGVYARSILRLPAALRHQEGLPSVLWRPTIPPVWNPSHGSAILSAMHFAKNLAPREYALRLVAKGRGQAGERGGLDHLLNIVREPFALAGFAQMWVRDRILAQRKLPSVFLPSHDRRYPMELNAEQFPDPTSRIALGSEVDRYGMPRITLNWSLGPGTEAGILRSLQLLAAAVPQAGLGRFDFNPDGLAPAMLPQGGHHIGTTRMAAEPKDGVVDTQSRVFGVENLFIAGPSVFPTSSCVNPTLMAVALAQRLADHLLGRT